MISEGLERASQRAGISSERFIRAIAFTILLVGVLYMIVSALPLKRAFPVRLSQDISAVLVKNGTRSLVDIIPETVMSRTRASAEWSVDPLQRQAVLNAYGAALKVLGKDSQSGYIVVKSNIGRAKVGSVVSESEKESYKGILSDNLETIWVNNTQFPEIEIPSILVSAEGNSDTAALTLYFLEVLTGKIWNNKYHFKITGALNDPLDEGTITSVGAAPDKAALKIESNEVLFMPVGNKINLRDEQSGIIFVNSIGSLIANICSLPHPGDLCKDTRIKPILDVENAKMQSSKFVAQLSNNQARGK